MIASDRCPVCSKLVAEVGGGRCWSGVCESCFALGQFHPALENIKMTDSQRLQSIHDLAAARLRNAPLDPNVEHDLKEIVKLSERSPHPHYPEGMGEESRRLHREYNALVAAQLRGEKNGPAVVKLTDECAAKGIILIPGGENL